MDKAKIFMNGKSQAVRLPKKYRFETDEVLIQEHELWAGVWASQRYQENEMTLTSFLQHFSKLTFDSSSARMYGRVKVEQNKAGKNIGPNDLLIAAQALDIEATIVTANEKEFKQIKDLKVENWLK